MPASTVVEYLDVIEDIGTGQVTGFVDTFFDALLFKTAEEGLSDCVVPTVTASAHAGLQVVGLQKT